ncbi:MAG TPA: hypothetical protein VNT26_09390, partial [Candidatus Sulfotelmatobacter sp.]|nr:hypothetical protein [Candidatus Sulfotelmatobacter sp.]
MQINYRCFPLAVLSLLGLLLCRESGSAQVHLWLSDPNADVRFEKQAPTMRWAEKAADLPAIEVEDGQTFQSMEGFGWCLTGGSAMHLMRMESASRSALLRELFGPEGLGSSYLRVSIGASDLNERVFSYDDLPEGQTDPELSRFSLGPDRADVIPVLKEILAINPRLKILGS